MGRLSARDSRMAKSVRRFDLAPEKEKSRNYIVNCFKCKRRGKTHCALKPRVKLRERIICEEYKK